MDKVFVPQYRIVTISGKIAVGTSTLAKNLNIILGWKNINIGAIQREFDRKNEIDENKQGANSRTDDHERSIESMTETMLKTEKKIIYEAWLAGFVARKIQGILKILLICSHDDVRIDRVTNRDNISIEDAKQCIKQREEENIEKWQKLYGKHDFWDPHYFDLVIDTYTTGPMETAGKVLDALGSRQK